jgi:Ca-activated chloride channel family protein
MQPCHPFNFKEMTMPASRRSLPALRHLLALGGLLFGMTAHASTPGSGELRLHDQAGHVQSLASLDTDVEYRVSGLVAEVQVRQQFRNTGKDWLEGEYLLPLPAGAAVYSMALDIGERRIVADIEAKEAARKVFEQAMAARPR